MTAQVKKLTSLLFLAIIAAIGVCFVVFENRKNDIVAKDGIAQKPQETQAVKTEEMKGEANPFISKEDKVIAGETKNVKREIGIVPFQVQAPGGKWSEPLFQNGCEEASIIMAARWVQNLGELDAGAMDKEIRRVSSVEEKLYGHAVDTSIEDTCKTIKQAFNVKNAQVIKLGTISDIPKQLEQGNLIVVNAFGRALGNPNFTSPGPITHMLVIIGYDAAKKQVITNDPGTKNGRGYRYDENVFWKALWNYPSGEEHPELPKNFGGPAKAIVVGK